MSKMARLKARRRKERRLKDRYGKMNPRYLYSKFEGSYLIPTVQELGFADIIRDLIPDNMDEPALKKLWKSGDHTLKQDQMGKKSYRRESREYLETIHSLRRHMDWVLSNFFGHCGAKLPDQMLSDILRPDTFW